MLTEVFIPTAHGSGHVLVPHVQHSEHYASPDIHTHDHIATSTIFTPGESLATDPYLISGPGPSTVTEEEPIDEVMMPEKSDRPHSYCCSCILVWNSVKDYWERLYRSVVCSKTKLLIGMLLSVASPKSVRAQGRTFTFVVGRFWGLCSVYILIMNEGFRPVEIFDPTLFTANRSIISLRSHGNFNGWTSDFCGSVWIQYLNARIFNRMKLLPVPSELTPEGFPGCLSAVLLDQSRVVSGCICYL